MSEKKQRFGTDLKENIIMLREMSQNTNGLLIRELTLSGCHYALISGANLINSLEVYNLSLIHILLTPISFLRNVLKKS